MEPEKRTLSADDALYWLSRQAKIDKDDIHPKALESLTSGNLAIVLPDGHLEITELGARTIEGLCRTAAEQTGEWLDQNPQWFQNGPYTEKPKED